MTSRFQRALLARSVWLAFAALFVLRTTNTRGEEPEDPEEARDRAGAGHVERLWYLPSPDAALWAREGPTTTQGGRKMTQETMSVESQASALREAANEIAHELPEIPGIHEHPMLTAALAMGFASAIGTAAFVGRNASGDYLVQFNNQSNNTGYSSAWPAWAYEVAKSSVENGKTLWVGSNGDPFGSNLVFVVEFP